MTPKNVVYFYSIHVHGYLHEVEAMYEYCLLCTLLCTVLFLGDLKHRILIFCVKIISIQAIAILPNSSFVSLIDQGSPASFLACHRLAGYWDENFITSFLQSMTSLSLLFSVSSPKKGKAKKCVSPLCCWKAEALRCFSS